jgi:hypothetical protein
MILRYDSLTSGEFLATVDTGFVQEIGIEYVMEVGIHGSTLEMRMWPVGEQRPELPQATAVDDTYLTGGIVLFARSGAGGEVSSTFDRHER